MKKKTLKKFQNMRNNKMNKTNKNGGTSYILGDIRKENGVNQLSNIGKLVKQNTTNYNDVNKVAYFGVTNLEHATPFPNKDRNFKYHSFMISKIVEIPFNELDNLKWAINGYLSEFVEKLNTTNNSLGIKYDLNHVKICDCNYDFLTPNSIKFSGNIYVYDSDKLNSKIKSRLPDDVIKHGIEPYIKSHIKSHIKKP